MARVFKYVLRVEQREMIFMPEGAQIISLGVENEAPVLYVVIPDEDVPLEQRFIRVVTTGDEFNHKGCAFIGTVKLNDWFVAHVFEQMPAIGDSTNRRWLQDFRQIRNEIGNA
jgi:hypothetical protein